MISAVHPHPTVDHTMRVGQVTHESVRARTRELALFAGRVPPHVTQADYEQAKRELTGESDLDRQQAMIVSP